MDRDTILFAVAVIGCLIGLYGWWTGQKKSTKEETHNADEVLRAMSENNIKINLKLDQLCATTNETRTDIKSMNSRITELDKEITVLQRDMKTAFNQIDDLKRGAYNHES